MFDPSGPLANRGPEALQKLLTTGIADAHKQVRLLTLSEMTGLAEAAGQLVMLVHLYVNRLCGSCGAPIAWNPNEPTGQAAGWRHVDQAASYRFGAHRALPIGSAR
jgi:hypothetical protein